MDRRIGRPGTERSADWLTPRVDNPAAKMEFEAATSSWSSLPTMTQGRRRAVLRAGRLRRRTGRRHRAVPTPSTRCLAAVEQVASTSEDAEEWSVGRSSTTCRSTPGGRAPVAGPSTLAVLEAIEDLYLACRAPSTQMTPLGPTDALWTIPLPSSSRSPGSSAMSWTLPSRHARERRSSPRRSRGPSCTDARGRCSCNRVRSARPRATRPSSFSFCSASSRLSGRPSRRDTVTPSSSAIAPPYVAGAQLRILAPCSFSWLQCMLTAALRPPRR